MAAPLQAAVTYTFAGNSANAFIIVGPQSFTLNTPDFVNTNTTFKQFTAGNATGAQFCFSGESCGGFFSVPNGNYGVAVTNPGGSALYLFSANPFGAAGVYNTVATTGNVATLTVTGAPTVAAVPEPATWAMMGLGFGGTGYALRRRSKVNTRIRFA